MADAIGKPAGRQLERKYSEIASREDGGDESGGDLPFLHPPEQVEAMHQPFNGGDAIGQVEGEVSLVAGSIRRHGRQGSRIPPWPTMRDRQKGRPRAFY